MKEVIDIANTIQILLISGSIRQPSYTRILTKRVETVLIAHGAATTHWNLRNTPLPIANPEFHHNPAQHTDERVRTLVDFAEACDAFVLSSPIYHNSYSGVLKNTLDHLAIPQFYYKPVGLISHGGNRSTQAVDHLRIVVRGLLGISIPTQVCTAKQDYQEIDEENYKLGSEEIIRRVERFASELVLFAHQLRLIRQNILQV